MNSSLWQISVNASPESEEMVLSALETVFAQPATIYSDAKKKVSTISVYLDKFSPSDLEELKQHKELSRAKISVKKLRRQDWAESWKKHFHPLQIGSTLLIKPSWSKLRPKKNQAVVILDPGLSFGTGQHPTTEFCLRQIVAVVWDRRLGLRRSQTAATTKSFLDIGTGSGILAIAAAKLGYAPVEAFDFDPDAVRIAIANAKTNRVHEKISFKQADLTKQRVHRARKFDLVCANLISNLLMDQREKIMSRLKPDGVLVLAGILKNEFVQVQKCFEVAGMKMISSRAQKEWRSGAFVCEKTF